MLRQSFSIWFGLLSIAGISQCPTITSSIPDQACIESNLDIVNTSDDQYLFNWDFCDDQLDPATFNVELLSSITSVSRILDIAIVDDNDYKYGIAVSWQDDDVLRLHFGNGHKSEPTNIVNLGDFGLLDQPVSVEMIKQDDVWYGLVYCFTGDLIRLNFQNGLSNTPIAELVASGIGAVRSKMELVDSNSELKAVVINEDETITIVDFNNDITYNPTMDDIDISSVITGLTNPRDIEVFRLCDQWYGFISSFSSRIVTRVDFGSTLTSTINDSETLIGDEFGANINRIALMKSGGSYDLQVFTSAGTLFNVEIGTDPLVTGLGSSSVFQYGTSETYAQGFALEAVKIDGAWSGYIFDDLSGELYHITYENDCPVSQPTSTMKEPKNIHYLSDGSYNILLEVETNTGTRNFVREQITVLDQTAPSISHSSQEVCVSNPITFSPSNPGLSSYSWDFDGDGSYEITDDNTGSDQSFDYSGLGPGTYTVRLDVNDGTCDNFYEEEITIYSNPPIPAFTVVANECVNTDISFTNDTDESQHTGVISYMWDFDNDGIIDSTDPDPTFAYSTPGTKTVVLYDTIPGCSNVSATFDIDISSGPIAGYAPSTLSACEGETIAFTDTSSVDSQDYFWDFQNGFTSTISNPPAQLYEISGSYFVSLTTTDAQGCEDTFVQEISISASPEISIDFDIPCTSPDGVQFFDLTTVDGADIVSWSWEVDGEEVSNQQNPTINFSSTGVKTIGLTVQSSNGCEQYATEDIEVLAAPSPDFSIDLGCQGEATSFTDETESVGNPIVSWLWTVDGVNYGTQDINHVFTNPGSFDVILEVTGQNFCSEIITKTVEIIELPQVNFTVNGECDNQVISAQDQSTGSADPVISRRWMLDGVNVGNGNQLLLSELEDNSYELELELETESGCLVSSSQTLEINEAPEAEFTSSRTYGIPGDRLTFTNNSSGGVSYQWLLDGELRSANSGAESIEFSTAGSYDVSLVAQNSLGCNDTTTREILIAIPEVDLAIGDFELTDEKTGEIYLEIQNFSNLPVETTEVQIVLANEFSVNEQINAFIGIGESFSKILSVKIPQAISKPSYFCVKLISQYEELEYSDLNPINNEKCLTLLPAVQVENPFPNPVLDQFRLKVVTPADGQVSLRLINAAGKLHREETYQASAGLNNFFIDMSTLNPGIYFVTVDVFGNTFKRKVVKL